MALRMKVSQMKRDLSHEDVHFMPCRIHTEGQHRITEYFKPYLKYSKTGEVKVSFRGHPLHGKILNLPKNYIGVIAEGGKCVDSGTRNLYVTSTFSSMTFWNWDKPPSKNDAFYKALDWMEIAEALHSSDMESES
ncbi:ribonuclease H2 subunit C [Hetaerina americana]|uniref:ribonuclease H2 subunit C n=1 Tax=Hetaerina americana TaxID=62018 RepID=UPI003A7F3E78